MTPLGGNLLATAGEDGLVFVWDVRHPSTEPLASFEGNNGIVRGIVALADRGDHRLRLAVVGDDSHGRVWVEGPGVDGQEVARGSGLWNKERKLVGHNGPVLCIAAIPKHTTLLATGGSD